METLRQSDPLRLAAASHRDRRLSVSCLLVFLSAAVLSTTVSVGYYALSRQMFERSKSEEKLTLLQLVNAMVTTYTELRHDDAAIPQTFQARALGSFAEMNGSDAVRIGWIGVPGRQIGRGPTDVQMSDWINALAADPAPRPDTQLVETGGERLLRTVFPSVAMQESCVSCHNDIHPERRQWEIGEVMGAFVLDVPVGGFLDRLLREAMLLGFVMFGATGAIGIGLRWVSLRRTAAEVQRKLYARFAEAVESMTDGFALFDEDNACVMANSAYRRRSGRAADGGGGAAPVRQHSEIGRDGSGCWIKTDETLTPSGMTVRLQTDITALKTREAELVAAKELAERASRARAEFLALMSHELRTPLNAIIGFSEIMRDNLLGRLEPRYREYAIDINESGRHLLTIITDILDVAKADAGKMELANEDVDLAEIFESCRRLIAGKAHQCGIELEFEMPDITLWADPVKLKQVFINLLSNAVKFTPSGGRVRVSAEATGGEVMVVIADTGIGIAEPDLPRVMEPFVQVSPHLHAVGGTGLGLPLTRKLVELHHGRIAIESRIGAGTRVTVTLPRRARRMVRLDEGSMRGAGTSAESAPATAGAPHRPTWTSA